MPMENTKPNIIEMAKKKRHLFLLEKMQKGKALTRAEIRELDKFENSKPAPGVVDTQRDVARHFKVSVRTIQFWTAEGMPVMPDGRHNIREIKAWRKARGIKQKPAEQLSKESSEARLREIKIKREEVKLKKELGELIAKSEVEGVLVQLISVFKRSFLSLGRNLAPQLAGREPREIDAVITGRVREIIQDFSEGKRIFKK
jgi:hypothetical protein